MPVIAVSKAQLFALLEDSWTDSAFGDVCFEFGLELDDVIENPDKSVDYKIEVPANRYDLLCIEGIARAFRYFLGKDTQLPQYTSVTPTNPLRMVIDKSILSLRPLVVCAVLRGIQFTPDSYNSFIALQEKLHHNICRRRTLASVGTHDLDTIQGPFSYEGVAPKNFKFIPLRQTTEVDGLGMIELLKKDEHLKEFTPLIENEPVFPVIFDANRTVLSVPPLINGSHSKITLNTKNVFIEVTGIDATKVSIVLDMVCTMFSQYCTNAFHVERVEVLTPGHSEAVLTPDWDTNRTLEVGIDYLSKLIGLTIESDKVVEYLNKMQLPANLSSGGDSVIVTVPPLRSDILHPCDVLEDVAIGYGFPKILDNAVRPTTLSAGVQQPIEKFSSTLRKELALAGYTEVLSFSLCSHADNFENIRKPEDSQSVVVSNPQGIEFQELRRTLYTGLLKTAFHSQSIGLPLCLFEISDICFLTNEEDVGAKNQRCLSALRVDTSSNFEVIHGLLDRVLAMNRVLHYLDYQKWYEYYKAKDDKIEGLIYDKYYRIVPGDEGIFLPGTCGKLIVYDTKQNLELDLGTIGIIHPEVLENFGLSFPISAFHINIEPLL